LHQFIQFPMVWHNYKQRGLSLIEVVIVSAIVTVIFAGLLGGFVYILNLINDTKSRQTALSVANDRMEFIRSLSYDAVGTVSGIPSGAIPQVATTSLNGIVFTIRTLIEYIDDPADGLGVNDDNLITTDYKQAKVTVEWVSNGATSSVFMVSNVIPRSIETDVGGGTLRVNVFDSSVIPMPNATVRLVNNQLTPVIDVTRTTNASGIALFGGAPAGAGYEVTVSRSGYSSDGTTVPSLAIPNPSNPPATVAEADVTTLNFFIDEVSDVTIRTVTTRIAGTITEPMNDMLGVATSTSSVVMTGGELLLFETAGIYPSTGEILFVPIAPPSVASWGTVTVTSTTSLDTSVRVRLYSTASTTLVADSDLPGNSVGFLSSVIDISSLSPSTYPSLHVGLTLETASSTQTPIVDQIEISYVASETVAPNIPFTIRGNKSLGSNASSAPVYKFNVTTATNGSGELDFSDLEFDAYTVTPIGYTIREACPANPITIQPGTDSTLTLTVGPAVAHSLRVLVTTTSGVVIPGASVTLTRSGFSATEIGSGCGQVFFGPVANEIDYGLEVSAPGYSPVVLSDVVINGVTELIIQL
jgi:prepilin-type N-terminal cleavage/methylation domain-containing protein